MKRLISALLLGPIALALICLHPATFFIVVLPAYLLSLHEWRGMVTGAPIHKIPTAVFGFIYITACFAAFTWLRFEDTGWLMVLWVLLTVWASDTGAYVFGKAYGGPKLAPKISPNKTWAGLGGAMLGAGLATMVLGLFLYAHDLGPFEYSRDFFIGAGLGLIAQIGDLLISIFKRRANVKDTGALIPGHGGILDRIDALMFVALCVAAYAILT